MAGAADAYTHHHQRKSTYTISHVVRLGLSDSELDSRASARPSHRRAAHAPRFERSGLGMVADIESCRGSAGPCRSRDKPRASLSAARGNERWFTWLILRAPAAQPEVVLHEHVQQVRGRASRPCFKVERLPGVAVK